MRFECDSCRAQYNIAEEKVGPKGVKVRCKKCGHVIHVRREEIAPAPPPPVADDDALPTVVMAQAPFPTEDEAPASMEAASPRISRGGNGVLAGLDDDEIGAVFDQALGGFDRSDDGGDGGGDDEVSTRVLEPSVVKKLAEESAAAADFEAPAAAAAPAAHHDWFVAIDDRQVGPLSLDEVKKRWDSGEVGPDTLCWRAGLDDWMPLIEVSELSSVLSPQTKAPVIYAPEPAPAPARRTPATRMEAPAAAAAASEGGGWRPSAGSALASLAAEEIESLARPAKATPRRPMARVAGLLDVPSAEYARPTSFTAPAPEASIARTSALPVTPAASVAPLAPVGQAIAQAAAESIPAPAPAPIAAPAPVARPASPSASPYETSYQPIIPPRRKARALRMGIAAGVAAALIAVAGGGYVFFKQGNAIALPSLGGAAEPSAPVATAEAAAPAATAPEAQNAQAAAPAETATAQAADAPAAAGSIPANAVAAATPPAPAAATPEPPAVKPPPKIDPPSSARRDEPRRIAAAAPRRERSSGDGDVITARSSSSSASLPTGSDDEFAKTFGVSSKRRDEPVKVADARPPKRDVYVPPAPGSADIPERLGSSDIMAVVLANKPSIVKCVNEQKSKDPGLSGKLVMRWIVKTNGRTAGIAAQSAELRSTHLAGCITGLIRGWKFPAHRVQGEPIDFPFTF